MAPERRCSSRAILAARSAFVSPEARKCAMRRFAAIHEKTPVVIERRDALSERCDLRVEVLDHRATVVLLCVEKDASQGGRNEVVVFLWDDGKVERH